MAQILIEIAKKRGYEDGETSDAIEKRGPIKMEERTIQVMKNSFLWCLFSVILYTIILHIGKSSKINREKLFVAKNNCILFIDIHGCFLMKKKKC